MLNQVREYLLEALSRVDDWELEQGRSQVLLHKYVNIRIFKLDDVGGLRINGVEVFGVANRDVVKAVESVLDYLVGNKEALERANREANLNSGLSQLKAFLERSE